MSLIPRRGLPAALKLVRAASTAPAALSYASGVSSKPLVGHTIGHAFDLTVATKPERLAVISPWERVEWRYAEFGAQVDAAAATLLKLGLQRGDRVGVWSPNCAAWAVLQYATAKAGLVLVTLNPSYKPPELEFALNAAGVKVLFTAAHHRSTDYIRMVRSILPELDDVAVHHGSAGGGGGAHGNGHANSHARGRGRPTELRSKAVPSLRHVVSLDGGRHRGMHAWADFVATAGHGDVRDMQAASALLGSDDPINVQFSSGTTGRPKAIVLSHHNILNNAIIVQDNLGLTAADVIVNNVPLFHCFGLVMGSLGAVERGAAQIFPSQGFEAEASLRAAADYGGTAMYGVPTMFVQLLEQASLPQLRPRLRLRTGIMAGSTCPVELMRQVDSRMGIKELVICYGMTETSPVSLQTARSDPEWARTETVGRVVPHTEVRIVDSEGRTVPRGVKGELCTRGYCVMRGYAAAPAAPAAAAAPAGASSACSGGLAIDASKTGEAIRHGWMHTGDLAEMDAAGYVRIVGRIKDMIIRGGENVYPREVEEVLHTRAGVSDVAVFGVADATYGEEVAAYVVLKPGYAGALTLGHHHANSSKSSSSRSSSSAPAVPAAAGGGATSPNSDSAAGAGDAAGQETLRVTDAELRDFLRARLASYKVPKVWRFVPALPKTASGKIQKFVARAELEAELRASAGAKL